MSQNYDESLLILDSANVLSDSEYNALKEKATRITEEYECETAILIADTSEGYDIVDFADDFYDYKGLGYGPNYDGTLLFIAVEDRNYAFTTYGTAVDAFKRSRTGDTNSALEDYLIADDWYGAADEFLSRCETYLANPVTVGSSLGLAIPLSLVAGFILSWIPMSFMKSSLKSVENKHNANDEISSIKVTNRKDIFLNSTETRRELPQNDGGGTHRSSSGRSHGGGHGSF